MGEIEPHRFGQACAIKLDKGIFGFGKLAGSQRCSLGVRPLASLTINPRTGIRERVETLSDHSSASEFFAKMDTPAFVFLMDVYAGGKLGDGFFRAEPRLTCPKIAPQLQVLCKSRDSKSCSLRECGFDPLRRHFSGRRINKGSAGLHQILGMG